MAPEPSPTPLPPPYSGTGPFAFVSYKRHDIQRIAPVLAEIRGRGWQLWIDNGIPGGAEWDAVLEERIQSCAVLLAFLSQASVESKYCRREIKFADALDKPILAVELERVQLLLGLEMLLQQYQRIRLADSTAIDAIDHGLRTLGAAAP